MWLPFPETRALITFPNAERDKLIFDAYFSLYPVDPLLDCRYDPARSTKLNFDALNLYCPWIISEDSM